MLSIYKSFTLTLIAAFVVSCSAVAPLRKGNERREREAQLRNELMAMRKAIDTYAIEQGKLPKSLDDLLRAKYLREIPADPITQKPDWKLITGEDPNRQRETGIVDIRSSSSEISSEGKPYNEW